MLELPQANKAKDCLKNYPHFLLRRGLSVSYWYLRVFLPLCNLCPPPEKSLGQCRPLSREDIIIDLS